MDYAMDLQLFPTIYLLSSIFATSFGNAENNAYIRSKSMSRIEIGNLMTEISGKPGVDYPIYSVIPPTMFSCSNQKYPGYYADPTTQCQVFYNCQRGRRFSDGFLCPNGTIFNQKLLVCDWWYNVNCAEAEKQYNVNGEVVQQMAMNIYMMLYDLVPIFNGVSNNTKRRRIQIVRDNQKFMKKKMVGISYVDESYMATSTERMRSNFNYNLPKRSYKSYLPL